ncbi:MAG: hypothetical protein K2L98_03295, partial [Bacilli bacterium]|nr:hypothetical protein [Bacilli bacterium]
MKAKLENIWNALLKLDAENRRTDAQIADLTNEFNDLVEKADQGITVIEEDDPNNSLAIRENQLDLAVFVGELESFDQVYDEYVKAKGNVTLMILASIVFVLLALSLESLLFRFNIVGSLFFPAIGIL